MKIPFGVIVLAGIVALAGCSKGGLRELQKPGTGPDEFLVLPAKPLSQPDSYAQLPVPTPGGANITDPNPNADAVAALGGSPTLLAAGDGVPERDLALVRSSGRYGVQPDIRESLAAEDAAFRKRENRTARFKLFNVDRYSDAYKRQTLDPHTVNQQFRRAGVPTPSAPPADGY